MIDEYGSPLRSQAWFSSQRCSMIVEAGGTFFARAMSRSRMRARTDRHDFTALSGGHVDSSVIFRRGIRKLLPEVF
jgi:hypothetical protein